VLALVRHPPKPLSRPPLAAPRPDVPERSGSDRRTLGQLLAGAALLAALGALVPALLPLWLRDLAWGAVLGIPVVLVARRGPR
jgi:hypothetical protein